MSVGVHMLKELTKHWERLWCPFTFLLSVAVCKDGNHFLIVAAVCSNKKCMYPLMQTLLVFVLLDSLPLFPKWVSQTDNILL